MVVYAVETILFTSLGEKMSISRFIYVFGFLSLVGGYAVAQDHDMAALTERGKELYFEQVSCWVCHGDDAAVV